MKFARWEELTAEQKRHVHSLRRDWKPSDFILFEFARFEAAQFALDSASLLR